MNEKKKKELDVVPDIYMKNCYSGAFFKPDYPVDSKDSSTDIINTSSEEDFINNSIEHNL